MTEATVTTRGRITIPKGVRAAMKLAPGMQVEFVRVGPKDYQIVAVAAAREDDLD